MSDEKQVVARTFFTHNKETNQWYWRTKALNNEIVADGSEGYNNLEDAVNGYFSSQGVKYHNNIERWPDGYEAILISLNEYQINKYLK